MGKKKDIDDNKRAQIMQFLLDCSKGGKVQHGMMNTATLKFQVCGRTVRSIWNTAKTQFKGGRVIDVASKRCKVIRPKKHVIDYAAIEQIEVQKRGTIQGLSDALHISKYTVGRWNTTHLLRPHTSSIRSLLTAHNMLVRLSFSLQAIHQSPQLNCIQFKAMENTIHIDEKWFYLTRNTCRYYLTPMEENPHRVCKSKNFIPKVMFMCAVSRPVFDSEGRVLFDGKIGIWPFIEEVTARRSSINRKKGTKELKPMQHINRQVIRDIIIQQIVPTIKQKWPAFLSKNIKIQQDNARPHICNTDEEFQRVANEDGFQIQLVQQPPNSPDCNALDLGFFCAIQALQQRQKCKSATELIEAVKNSFSLIDPMTLNKVFLTLQCVLIQIMKQKGQNNFNPPHMKKNALLKQRLLPTNLEVPKHIVLEGIDHLLKEEFTSDITELLDQMGISVPQNGETLLDLNI